MKRPTAALAILALAGCGAQTEAPGSAPALTKALIVDGQSSIYHKDWAARTALMKGLLEATGLFTVEVATRPAIGSSAPAAQGKLLRSAVCVTPRPSSLMATLFVFVDASTHRSRRASAAARTGASRPRSAVLA